MTELSFMSYMAFMADMVLMKFKQSHISSNFNFNDDNLPHADIYS